VGKVVTRLVGARRFWWFKTHMGAQRVSCREWLWKTTCLLKSNELLVAYGETRLEGGVVENVGF